METEKTLNSVNSTNDDPEYETFTASGRHIHVQPGDDLADVLPGKTT